MNGWGIAIIAMMACDVYLPLARHGETKTTKYNVWASMIATAIMGFIYYKAGLWS